jgi:hypothetical protein
VTVAELIEKLKAMPQESPVYISEGPSPEIECGSVLLKTGAVVLLCPGWVTSKSEGMER